MMSSRIALFLIDSGDYQGLLWSDGLRAATRHGFPVITFWAENDSRRQIKQIQSCLNEPEVSRSTVFLVCPVREVALIQMAYQAASLGIGWVQLLRWSDYLRALRHEFPRLPIFSVMADQLALGAIQGRQLRARVPDGGIVVYVRGPIGTSSAMRWFSGLEQDLGQASVDLVTLTADWSAAGGASAMRDWLRTFDGRELPRFVVGAQNDAMAMGARRALEQFAQEHPSASAAAIAVCGSDGTPTYGQRLVTEGKLASTVIVPPATGRALDEIASMNRGGSPPPEQVLLEPRSFPDLSVLEERR